MEAEQNKKTTETIQKAEKNFALDLPLLVDETALSRFSAQSQPKKQTRLRTYFTRINHTEAILPPNLAYYFTMTQLGSRGILVAWNVQGATRKIRNCPSCRAASKNLKTQIPSAEINRLELLTGLNQETFNWTSVVQSNPKHAETFTF